MQYIPPKKHTNHNISPEPVLLTLARYLGIVAICIIALYSLFFVIAMVGKDSISLQQEISWFEDIDIIDDQINPKQTKYVQDIQQKIFPEEYKNISVNVVCNDEVNAFAAPGAKIIVYSGLIQTAQFEDEVAFVLLHELSHIHHRDVLQALINKAPLQFISNIIWPDGSWLTDTIGFAYDKKIELRSDREALYKVSEYYGDFSGVKNFFHTIREQSPDFLTWISDHPSTTARIEQISQIEKNNMLPKQKRAIIPADIQSECL